LEFIQQLEGMLLT